MLFNLLDAEAGSNSPRSLWIIFIIFGLITVVIMGLSIWKIIVENKNLTKDEIMEREKKKANKTTMIINAVFNSIFFSMLLLEMMENGYVYREKMYKVPILIKYFEFMVKWGISFSLILLVVGILINRMPIFGLVALAISLMFTLFCAIFLFGVIGSKYVFIIMIFINISCLMVSVSVVYKQLIKGE